MKAGEMQHGFLGQEVPQIQGRDPHLGQCRGNGRTEDAQREHDDQQVVHDAVQDDANHHDFGGFLRMPVRLQQNLKGIGHDKYHCKRSDGSDVLRHIGQGGFGSPQEQGQFLQLPEQEPGNQEGQHDQEREVLAEYLVGFFLPTFSQ